MTPCDLIGKPRRCGEIWLLHVSDMKEEGPYETFVPVYQTTRCDLKISILILTVVRT